MANNFIIVSSRDTWCSRGFINVCGMSVFDIVMRCVTQWSRTKTNMTLNSDAPYFEPEKVALCMEIDVYLARLAECHHLWCLSVTCRSLTRMMGYTNDQQLYHECHLVTLGNDVGSLMFRHENVQYCYEVWYTIV